MIHSSFAQGTAFLYQGQLGSGGGAANGSYNFEFTVYNAVTNGQAVSGTLTNSAVTVSNGLFTTTLDFGTNVFTGPSLWLGIGVCTNGSNTFTLLWPRQPILPTPYAIFANSASNLVGVLPASQLTGTLPASAFSGYTNTVAFTNSGNTFSGAFSGNGGGITNVNVTNLTGVLADSQLPSNTAYVNSNQTFTASNTFAGNNTFNGANVFTNLYGNSFSGSFFGNGLVGWVVVPGTTMSAQIDHGYVLTNAQAVTVTLPTSANVGDVIRVAYSGAAGWELAQNAGQSILGSFQAFVTSWYLDKQYDTWTCMAASSSGNVMVAAASQDNIYTSTDGGQVWTATSVAGDYGERAWQGVACSSDGTMLVGVVYGGGDIYTSTNTGSTWSVVTTPGNWTSVASSSDGTRYVAADYGSGLYGFLTNGVITSYSASPNDWTSVASSSGGNILLAADDTGSLYISSNYGTNWNAVSGTSGLNWQAVAISADGTKMAAAVHGGGIWTSVNSGSSWSQTTAPSTNWIFLASSSDGGKLVAAVSGGSIYTSASWGAAWTQQTNNIPATANWSAVTLAGNSSVVAAAINNNNQTSGGVYSSQAGSESVTTTGTIGYISAGQGSAVELICVRTNSQFMPVSSTGTIWGN